MTTIEKTVKVVISEIEEADATFRLRDGELSFYCDSKTVGFLYRRGTMSDIQAWLTRNGITIHPSGYSAVFALEMGISSDIQETPSIEKAGLHST